MCTGTTTKLHFHMLIIYFSTARIIPLTLIAAAIDVMAISSILRHMWGQLHKTKVLLLL